MSLLDLKNYLIQVRMTSLATLCAVFKAEPETIRCMLTHWVKKGKVRQCMKTGGCGSRCFKCPTLSTELYEWIDAEPACF